MWTLVLMVAAAYVGWWFGRLERTGCEAWADLLFADLGAAQAELRDERDRADYLADALRRGSTGRLPYDQAACDALALHYAARRKDRT